MERNGRDRLSFSGLNKIGSCAWFVADLDTIHWIASMAISLSAASHSPAGLFRWHPRKRCKIHMRKSLASSLVDGFMSPIFITKMGNGKSIVASKANLLIWIDNQSKKKHFWWQRYGKNLHYHSNRCFTVSFHKFSPSSSIFVAAPIFTTPLLPSYLLLPSCFNCFNVASIHLQPFLPGFILFLFLIHQSVFLIPCPFLTIFGITNIIIDLLNFQWFINVIDEWSSIRIYGNFNKYSTVYLVSYSRFWAILDYEYSIFWVIEFGNCGRYTYACGIASRRTKSPKGLLQQWMALIAKC